MTLNISFCPIVPANSSEGDFVSSIGIADSYIIEGSPEMSSDTYGQHQLVNWEFENFHDCGRVRGARGGSCEAVSNDVLDLLPIDPFGMKFGTSLSAITGWMGDFETKELNFVRNTAMRFHPYPNYMWIHDRRSNPADGFNWYAEEKDPVDKFCGGGGGSVCKTAELLSFNNEDTCFTSQQTNEPGEGNGIFSDGDPHEALPFVLGYLGVKDLLSAERACRTLCSAVRNDVLLWRNIHVDYPLSKRITDDALLGLTNRAQGKLQCLSLVMCSRITDDGLKRVLESNLALTKLNVLGCTRLSVDGIVNNLKCFKHISTLGIKQLRIGGLYGLTHKHYEELSSLVGADKCMQSKVHKPRFYQNRFSHSSCDDDHAIDVEICPRCQKLRIVYDCPTDSCLGKQTGAQACRACIFCIERCGQCGRCINETEYEETFCLDMLCLDCRKQPHPCQERREEKGTPSKHTILHHEAAK